MSYHPENTPTDMAADSRTVPHGVGYDMERDVSKGQWLALCVDLLRSQHGEAASVGVLRREIVERLDSLHAAGIVTRTLPRSRYPRPTDVEQGGAA